MRLPITHQRISSKILPSQIVQGQSIDRSQSGALESDRSKEWRLQRSSILHTREGFGDCFPPPLSPPRWFNFPFDLTSQTRMFHSHWTFKHTHSYYLERWIHRNREIFDAACTSKNCKIYEDGKKERRREMDRQRRDKFFFRSAIIARLSCESSAIIAKRVDVTQICMLKKKKKKKNLSNEIGSTRRVKNNFSKFTDWQAIVVMFAACQYINNKKLFYRVLSASQFGNQPSFQNTIQIYIKSRIGNTCQENHLMFLMYVMNKFFFRQK